MSLELREGPPVRLKHWVLRHLEEVERPALFLGEDILLGNHPVSKTDVFLPLLLREHAGNCNLMRLPAGLSLINKGFPVRGDDGKACGGYDNHHNSQTTQSLIHHEMDRR